MPAGKEIKRLRGKDVTASKAAKFIGVGVDRLRKWEERDTDPTDTGDIARVEAYFGCKLADLPALKSFDFVEFSREKSVANGLQKQYTNADLSIEAIKDLTETGKLREKNYEAMISNETRLIKMLQATVTSSKDNDVASPKVMSGILVALARVASGTRFHSEQEALRELGRLLSPQEDENTNVDDSIQSGVGKKRTV